MLQPLWTVGLYFCRSHRTPGFSTWVQAIPLSGHSLRQDSPELRCTGRTGLHCRLAEAL